MAIPTLTLGCVEFFDRTLPILKRQVSIAGFFSNPTPLKPDFSEFDVCEIPLFAYLALRALEDDRYIALPIFPHRGYPHGSAIHEKAASSIRAILSDTGLERQGCSFLGQYGCEVSSKTTLSGERAIWVTSPTV